MLPNLVKSVKILSDCGPSYSVIAGDFNTNTRNGIRLIKLISAGEALKTYKQLQVTVS